MYAISLTSIPSRFGHLGPVLRALLAQRPAPVAVYLCLPRAYRRFPGKVTPPTLPQGVELLRSDTDLGPAGKALIPARRLAGTVPRLIYCDDDWIYPPGWAEALLSGVSKGMASTGQGFSVARLKRQSHARQGFTDIAQGFAGVCIDPAWFAQSEMEPPAAAWPVDDIWLSGHLARQGIGVREVPRARGGMCPAFAETHALQITRIDGRSRRDSNLACLKELTRRYGLWPATTLH